MESFHQLAQKGIKFASWRCFGLGDCPSCNAEVAVHLAGHNLTKKLERSIKKLKDHVTEFQVARGHGNGTGSKKRLQVFRHQKYKVGQENHVVKPSLFPVTSFNPPSIISVFALVYVQILQHFLLPKCLLQYDVRPAFLTKPVHQKHVCKTLPFVVCMIPSDRFPWCEIAAFCFRKIGQEALHMY